MGERGAFRESVWLWTPSAVQVSYCVPRLLIHASPFLLILLPTLRALDTSLPPPKAVLHFPQGQGCSPPLATLM